MSSSTNPFDFSEYSSSRDDADNPWSGGSQSPWPPPEPFGSVAAPFAGPGGSTPGFGGAPADAFAVEQRPLVTAISQGRPPRAWLIGGGVVALLGLTAVALTLSGGSTVFAFIGWLLAGPAAFYLLAQHTVADMQQRARPVYAGSKAVQGTYWTVVVLGFVGIAVGAWQIAEWAGRL
ncbi:hypothetical protein [Rhodococcus aetherivorans]|uniref:hypothetical protein n=1 Tax=Rhodococcus aetherivorans TaxID=191292 RepID=UPI00364D259C